MVAQIVDQLVATAAKCSTPMEVVGQPVVGLPARGPVAIVWHVAETSAAVPVVAVLAVAEAVVHERFAPAQADSAKASLDPFPVA